MTLPVSSYEELLHRVRSLTYETRQLQRQIDSPLMDCQENGRHLISWPRSNTETSLKTSPDRNAALEPDKSNSSPEPFLKDVGSRWTKEQGASPEAKEQEEISSHENERLKMLGTHNAMCHSTTVVNAKQPVNPAESTLSYSYSYSSEQLGTKVEMVYNLLSMLGTHDRSEMTSTLLAMSSSPDSCRAMRQSGCLSLLVQLVHASGESNAVRERAAQALRNMVLCHGDDKRGRREARVLRLLEQTTNYCDTVSQQNQAHSEDAHPGPAIAALMKLSFDEEHRLAMCQLGALYVIARLIQVESGCKLECCITVRRYAGMALTNLTFGDGNNKALLCSMKPFMTALVSQLSTSSEDLTQVTASVLRNLSWRADAPSKQALREVAAVPALMKAAMTATKEPTLKSVLSALWNLSAHCNINKVDICNVEGAIQYLVRMLTYQSASKTLAIVENAGGILRNISSHIALREDYRKILRDNNSLPILLRQLQSASLTVVSNACGTLWNLSARCPTDQRALVALGAVPMLSSLAHSRHRMIAMGASAALKNLLPVRLQQHQEQQNSSGATLLVRKRRALEAELNSSLTETCDNIEPGPSWDSARSPTSPQSKEECDELNHSVQQLTLQDETLEQPVDYSLKYCEPEVKSVEPEEAFTVNFTKPEQEKKVFNGCFPEQVETEGDYAETDLDQLTDFSLRYNEEEQQDSTNNSFNKCEEPEKPEEAPEEPPMTVVSSPGKADGKAVTFETPLMFSRCSSLGSLSSCGEQPDDCQSSVVSEFSRITSGIMSPSDLPDSPTQTVPPSPRIKSAPIIPATVVEEEKPSGGIFDDAVVAFKEESTPAQFSLATSLSDLTFDEESHDVGCERKELELAAVSEEEDEHVLADCISIGMQNNRADASSPRTLKGRSPRPSGIPVKSSPRSPQPPQPSSDETPVQFCTEDTPASLSHATSHSELSLLCALSDDEADESDHDNMLAECIQSGMPQPQARDAPNVKKPTVKVPTVVPGVKVSVVQKTRPISMQTTRMRQLVSEDEVNIFATEGSPCTFSIHSSLSDLTINSRPENLDQDPIRENPSPLSSLDPDVSVDEGEVVTVLSGTSADDVTLADQEDQALLMQVISSGMPSAPSTDKMKDSTDTWAEDTTNDFPSLSLSAPVVQSFHSDNGKDTESRVIELESGRVALISHLEMESSYIGLDQVQPPSNMASIVSLNSSLSEIERIKPKFKISDSMLGGTDSYHDLEHTQPPSTMDSLPSMTMSVGPEKRKPKEGSLLENVRPPADLDDLPDLENSILSVASLSSEVADDDTIQAFTPPPQRKMTAKQRREMEKNRFNTYVIRAEAKEPPAQVETEEKPKKMTPKERRQADRERFKTRTIHDASIEMERLPSVDSNEASSPGSQEEFSSETFDDPPRPIVVKPPEVKVVRGGVKSSIPVVRSPVKVVPTPPPNGAGAKKKAIVAPLQRQGTFTKEEASSSIPLPVKKPAASPLKKGSVSAMKASSLSNVAGRGRASSLPTKAGCGVRVSVSNQSLKSVCSNDGASTRWHSNSSLNTSAPKKEPTSKIASLWKKVDESKKKQQTQGKDSRVWIQPEGKNKQAT